MIRAHIARGRPPPPAGAGLAPWRSALIAERAIDVTPMAVVAPPWDAH